MKALKIISKLSLTTGILLLIPISSGWLPEPISIYAILYEKMCNNNLEFHSRLISILTVSGYLFLLISLIARIYLRFNSTEVDDSSSNGKKALKIVIKVIFFIFLICILILSAIGLLIDNIDFSNVPR